MSFLLRFIMIMIYLSIIPFIIIIIDTMNYYCLFFLFGICNLKNMTDFSIIFLDYFYYMMNFILKKLFFYSQTLALFLYYCYSTPIFRINKIHPYFFCINMSTQNQLIRDQFILISLISNELDFLLNHVSQNKLILDQNQ